MCVCRDEAQTYIQGYSGAKYKKFKTKPEAELWYRTNLPQATTNPQTSTISSSTATFTNSSRTGVTHTLSTPPPIAVSKPTSQSVSRAVTTPAPQPVQIPRIAVPKNNTADIVYSDGACKSNGGHGAVGGIGVWWGPNDTRYDISFVLPCFIGVDWSLQGTYLRDALVFRRITERNLSCVNILHPLV